MNIPLVILQILAEASGTLPPSSMLRLQVEARVRPRPLKAVFDAEFEAMRVKGLILTKDNDLDDDDPFVLLDEKGEAQVAKMRL